MAERAEAAPERMSREAYRVWSARQPVRHELLNGAPVAVNPERVGHSVVKGNIFAALRDAVKAGKLPCRVMPDGATVEIGPDTDFEPDALVSCGQWTPPDQIATRDPMIVVEVLSPSSRGIDTGGKLVGYFQVPTIQHYLVVFADRRRVLHYRRGGVRPSVEIVSSGAITCDPPGLSITFDQIYEDVFDPPGEPEGDLP